jgi:HEAT repeat protein
MPDLNALSSSEKVLLVVAGLAVLVAILTAVGFVPWLVGRVFAFLRWVLETGFWIWERVLAGIPWPLLVLLIIGVHVILAYHSGPVVTILLGLLLLHVGFVCCLAYMAIDQERLDVARGYKALYNPAKGQQLALRLSQYGNRAGLPLLIAATLASVSGFALLNEGLADSWLGSDWYAPGHHQHYKRLTDEELALLRDQNPPPGYADFLVYSLLNLASAFDLIDVLNISRVEIISYVHPNRWPASLLLVMFRTFFMCVLVQQILTVFGKQRLIQESVRDFWSPHEPIQRRASENLVQLGGRAVEYLLRSLELVEYVTPEQREYLLRIIVTVGPSTGPMLLERLDNPRPVVREVAMVGLGKLKSLETLTRLVRFRLDENEGVRLSLVEALEMIAEEGADSVRKRWELQRRRPHLHKSWWPARKKEVTEPVDYDPVALTVQTLRQLLPDPSRAVRLGAARLLGRLKTDAQPAAAELAAQTRDPEESVREQAVRTLGEIGGPPQVAIPALVALLDEEGVPEVRVAVLAALGKFGPAAASAAGVLVGLVQERDDELRTAAAEALSNIGPLDASLLPHLVAGLKSPDNQVRLHAAEVIGIIGAGAEEAVPALMAALHDENARVRVQVTRALGELGECSVAALPALCGALRDKDFEVAAAAAHALGLIGPAASGAMASLLKASHHTNPGVRESVAWALGHIEGEPMAVLPRLAEMTRDDDADVRMTALIGLAGKTSLGQPRTEAFLAALEDEAPAVRAAAVAELPRLELPHEELIHRLLVAVNDVSDIVQIRAVDALSDLGDVPPTVMARLCRLLTEDSERVQVETLRGLARLGPRAEASVPTLFQIMQRANNEVRAQVLLAAAKIAPEEALPLFLGGLHDSDPEVRRRASAGLILCNSIPEEHLLTLAEAMKDPEAQVRANIVYVCLTKDLVRPEMYPMLAACTTEPDDGLRLNALRALREAPHDLLADILPRLVGDSVPGIRLLAAVRVLQRDPDSEEAITVVTEALHAAGPGYRRQALEFLRELDPAVLKTFEPVLAELDAVEDNARVRKQLEKTQETLAESSEEA